MNITRWMAVAAVGATALVVPAQVDAGGAVQVTGLQTPVESAPGTYTMTGGLIGMWYTTDFSLDGATPSGAVRASGTELFVGCHDADGDGTCGEDDPTGTIEFSFTYTGRFSATGLLHGRCHHPITGGMGDFTGVTGVLSFHDDPATGCSDYRGNLRWG
jgi:hypothetical protein